MTVMRLCLQVHVHMQGQEALFSENMPLREVIVHFKKQLSAGTPTVANVGTLSRTAQDASLQRGQGELGGPKDQRDILYKPFLGYSFTESCLYFHRR